MIHLRPQQLNFPGGAQALALEAPPTVSARAVIESLALPPPRAVVVLNGGTAPLPDTLNAALARVLCDGLARFATQERVTVVTGATDAGIFRLYGQGIAAHGRSAPCIGVTVADLVAYPDQTGGKGELEPHHSHFVLVRGAAWGDETAMMYGLVAALGGEAPALAVFAGGGAIVTQEMLACTRYGLPMVLLAGSGRATDAVLAARAGQPCADARLAQVARVGRVTPFDLRQEPATLHETLHVLLFEDGSQPDHIDEYPYHLT